MKSVLRVTMPPNLRVLRGQTIMNFLQENYPKWYTRKELAKLLNIPQASLDRIITTRLNPSGQINVDTTYGLERIQYRRGAKVVVAAPFKFIDELPSEMNIWIICEEYLMEADQSTGPLPPQRFAKNVMQAMMYGMALTDPADRQAYMEFVAA